MDEIKLGIIGLGEFSAQFFEVYKHHPKITYLAAAEFFEERREKYKSYFDNVYESADEMFEKDKEINCVGVFAQRHQHGPLIIDALKKGYNVMTAVPMGCTVEEIKEIVRLVEETGLKFMMLETCYYWPDAVYAREKYKSGEMGKFVYGESQYYHTIEEMFGSFKSAGDGWKRVAGIPPMYYATHSISMMFAAINDYATKVSCFGYEDTENDGIYGKGMNDWDNPYSNETAIFTMSKGGFARINEFRRIGNAKPTSYVTGLYGTKGIYEHSGMQHIFAQNPEGHWSSYKMEDVSDLVNVDAYLEDRPPLSEAHGYKYHCGFSKVHNTERLPKEIMALYKKAREEDLNNIIGHNGSHILLVDDFVRCCLTDKQPFINAWESARYTIPGIIAHDSAMNGGKEMEIPDCGSMPDNFELMDYEDLKYED